MALTEFGKELRKLRIENNEKLLDMSKKIEKSVAFLSAVETSRKPLPMGFEEIVIRVYKLGSEMANRLRKAADRSRDAFIINPNTDVARDTTGLLARKVNTLSEEQLNKIFHILQGEEKK